MAGDYISQSQSKFILVLLFTVYVNSISTKGADYAHPFALLAYKNHLITPLLFNQVILYDERLFVDGFTSFYLNLLTGQ